MIIIIILISLLYILYLFWESYENKRIRKSFKHIIHVNGTRGKSSTSRLIEAALRGGDYKVFCKTTGTSPRTIDVLGVEKPIVRKGAPNIKEQIMILREASKQGADILVIECMAVRPELQYISQNRILDADISIVTNTRRDHLEEMGPRLLDVAKSLGKVMPRNGHFITGEKGFIKYYTERGKGLNTQVYLAEDLDSDYGIDFKDNVSIALEVCRILGIEKDIAIDRMKKYKKDPGVLKSFKIESKDEQNILFINGFAINDPDSIIIIYNDLKDKGFFDSKEFILLVNNRRDRVYRMQQHIEVIEELVPDEIWITGDYKKLMKRDLVRSGSNKELIHIVDNVEAMKIQSLKNDSIIFAIGNIVGNGEKILEYIERIGEEIV